MDCAGLAGTASFFSFALDPAAGLPGGELDGSPSSSAANGDPGMSLRLWTKMRRASAKVISTLLSETISEMKPLPNFGWKTIWFSR